MSARGQRKNSARWPATMALGDFLVAYLQRAGVSHIFGLPGDLALGSLPPVWSGARPRDRQLFPRADRGLFGRRLRPQHATTWSRVRDLRCGGPQRGQRRRGLLRRAGSLARHLGGARRRRAEDREDPSPGEGCGSPVPDLRRIDVHRTDCRATGTRGPADSRRDFAHHVGDAPRLPGDPS